MKVSAADFAKLKELLLKSSGKESLTIVAPDAIYARNVHPRDQQEFMEALREVIGYEAVNQAVKSGKPLTIQVR
jgi:hypothetical protein